MNVSTIARPAFAGAVLGAVLVPQAPTSAAAATTCLGEVIAGFAPGLGLAGSSGRISARDGTVRCDGPVQGRTLTGSGAFDAGGRYGVSRPADCLSGGDGDATQTYTFPTDTGPLVIENVITYTFAPLTADGPLSGRYEGDHADGTLMLLPTEGNCVTEPVTSGSVRFTVTFHGGGVSPQRLASVRDVIP